MKAVFAQAESCCVYIKPQNIMQHMHGISPYMFYSSPIQLFISFY